MDRQEANHRVERNNLTARENALIDRLLGRYGVPPISKPVEHEEDAPRPKTVRAVGPSAVRARSFSREAVLEEAKERLGEPQERAS